MSFITQNVSAEQLESILSSLPIPKSAPTQRALSVRSSIQIFANRKSIKSVRKNRTKVKVHTPENTITLWLTTNDTFEKFISSLIDRIPLAAYSDIAYMNAESDNLEFIEDQSDFQLALKQNLNLVHFYLQ
ncbi:hypothetical protein HDV06_001544 [Boothiomyces sp. JEL0866]|nr:hypothetical protein HDV06_001544 [Boothiomyces sp. JEL0866]